MPEEVSVTFDSKVDSNDDAIDRSRYELFYRRSRGCFDQTDQNAQNQHFDQSRTE